MIFDNTDRCNYYSWCWSVAKAGEGDSEIIAKPCITKNISTICVTGLLLKSNCNYCANSVKSKISKKLNSIKVPFFITGQTKYLSIWKLTIKTIQKSHLYIFFVWITSMSFENKWIICNNYIRKCLRLLHFLTLLKWGGNTHDDGIT